MHAQYRAGQVAGRHIGGEDLRELTRERILRPLCGRVAALREQRRRVDLDVGDMERRGRLRDRFG